MTAVTTVIKPSPTRKDFPAFDKPNLQAPQPDQSSI
jgi:hypothetical protein